MRKKVRILASALAGTALVASLGVCAGVASAAGGPQAPGSSTSWTIPTQSMTNTVVKDGKTYKVINTWAAMWAAEGPDYLGVSNSCALTSADNNGVITKTLDQVKTSTMLGVWASSANESPNAFNWNTLYNMYQDAQGGVDKSDQATVTNNWSSETGTMACFKYRPEVIWCSSRLSMTTSTNKTANMGASKAAELIRKGEFYTSYDASKENTPVTDTSKYACPNDSTYNPISVTGAFMNAFTFCEAFYDLSDAAEKVIEETKDYTGTASDTGWQAQNKLPRTTRYEESPAMCALNYEKISRGSLYYVLAKIADGTTTKKKVAFLTKDPQLTESTATVIVHDYVGETGATDKYGVDGGYPNISPIAVDQLSTDKLIESGGRQIQGNSTATADGGNSLTTDLPYATYTATADELASCDYIWDLNGSMNKTQLKAWLASKVTTAEAKARVNEDKVDYVGNCPAATLSGRYSAEKLMAGAYAVNFFYPELFPNMELVAFWYDEVYHLNTDAVPVAMSWGFGNADLPNNTDLSNIGSTYSLDDMQAKFAEGYNYYAKAKTTDPTISRILAGKSLDGTQTYEFLYFEPSQTYADWTAQWDAEHAAKPQTAAAQTLKVTPAKKVFKKAKVAKKAQTYKLTVKGAKTKVTYKSASKKVKVTAKGKVTVKKGTKKGTYKITVKAAATSAYKAASKTVKVVVK